MKIEIYTKPNCPNCVSAKQLLKSKGLEYGEYDVEAEAWSLKALLEGHPDARQMPQIFINNQRVGGLAGLQAALKQLGL
jgi:glutaredoxin 3